MKLDGRTKEGKAAKESARQRRNEYHRDYRASMTERQWDKVLERQREYRAQRKKEVNNEN
jgi:hypothetical protein